MSHDDAKRKILAQKKNEVTRAGSLFLRAMFGDHTEVGRELAEDIARERRRRGALTVQGHDDDD